MYIFRRTLALVLVLAPVGYAQNPTAPPPTQHAVLTVTGKGAQIYACQQVSGTPQWVFQAPEAMLFDAEGNMVGTHSAGSTVKAQVLATSPSPEPKAIPWLLLKATIAEGTGVMSKVELIRRSDTHGGVAPATGCDAQHLSEHSRVPYMATYTFYSQKP
jgi:Protein of unknown function (DUF3455)